MKRFLIGGLLLVLVLPLQPRPKGSPSILEGVQITPLELREPTVATSALPGAGQLLVLRSPDLPIVDLTIYFEGGTNHEPIRRAGALSALGQLLEIGGAGPRDSAEFGRLLAELGSSIDVKVNYEFWSVSLRSLPEHFPRSLNLLEDVLLRPRLPQQELTVIQNSLLTSIRQRNNRADGIARRKFEEILYAGLRRGYSLQESDVRRLSVQELREERERRLTVRGARVALSGMVTEDTQERVRRLVGRLPQGAVQGRAEVLPKNGPFEHSRFRESIVLVRKNAVQSAIVMGGLLPPHRHPDFYALQLCNQILGGGSFNSRLMREVRVKRGLAYYAYSYNAFARDWGRFTAGSATRIPTTAETTRLMLAEIAGMQQGISAEELHLARESILNALVFQAANPAAYLDAQVRFLRHRMPKDYLSRFPKELRALSQKDVLRVARRIDPAQLFVVVAGPESLRKSLEGIRPVIVIDPEDPVRP